MSIPPGMFERVRSLILERFGLAFEGTRLEDLADLLQRTPLSLGSDSAEAFFRRLVEQSEDGPDWKRLAVAVTIGETCFFRDPGLFAGLSTRELAELIHLRRREGRLSLRIWSAGCSTGEEAYSLAILLDRLLPDRADWSLHLVATDLNRRSIAAATEGVYRSWSLRQLPDDVRERYFGRAPDGTFRLDPGIRRLVDFTYLNLAGTRFPCPETQAMDLILCRNVLMYFSEEARIACHERLLRALAPEGSLVLNAVDALPRLGDPFRLIHRQGAVFVTKRRNAFPTSPAAAGPPGPVAENRRSLGEIFFEAGSPARGNA